MSECKCKMEDLMRRGCKGECNRDTEYLTEGEMDPSRTLHTGELWQPKQELEPEEEAGIVARHQANHYVHHRIDEGKTLREACELARVNLGLSYDDTTKMYNEFLNPDDDEEPELTVEQAWIDARAQFARAAETLRDIWEIADPTGHVVGNYPFKSSFDEIARDICDWAETKIKK